MLENILTKPANLARNVPQYPTYNTNQLVKKVSRLPTQDELPCDDGVPMETERHRMQMELLISSLEPWLYGHTKGYVGGNMFVYFSEKQIKNQDFKGPDVFVVLGVSNVERKSWVVWEEGKGLDIVIELLSESTTTTDKTTKKEVYQDQLKVQEYYWFDPFDSQDFVGWELDEQGTYQKKLFDAQEGMISKQLGLALVRWHGEFHRRKAVWLRWATLEGELLFTDNERAEQECKAKEQERKAKKKERRAKKWERQEKEQAQKQVELLANKLRALGIDPNELG